MKKRFKGSWVQRFLFWHIGGHTINAETEKALAEYESMKENPEKYKRYHSFSEVLKDIDN